jgi:predicted DNA-binding ArsR family transcriptional regulator
MMLFELLQLRIKSTLLYLQVIDASWYMPNDQRNPLQEYQVYYLSAVLLKFWVLYKPVVLSANYQ